MAAARAHALRVSINISRDSASALNSIMILLYQVLFRLCTRIIEKSFQQAFFSGALIYAGFTKSRLFIRYLVPPTMKEWRKTRMTSPRLSVSSTRTGPA